MIQLILWSVLGISFYIAYSETSLDFNEFNVSSRNIDATPYNFSSLYDRILGPDSLIHESSVSNSTQLSTIELVTNRNGDEYYCFEDSICRVNGLYVKSVNSLYSRRSQSTTVMVTLSIPSEYGFIFVLNQYNLLFANSSSKTHSKDVSYAYNGTMDTVEFVGEIDDVNIALKSVIVQPKEHWNSVLKPTSVKNAVQQLVITRQAVLDEQLITVTYINESYTSKYNSSFEIGLDCYQYGQVFMNTLFGAISLALTNHSFASTNISEVSLQVSVTSLIDQCQQSIRNVLEFQNITSTEPLFIDISVVVSKASQSVNYVVEKDVFSIRFKSMNELVGFHEKFPVLYVTVSSLQQLYDKSLDVSIVNEANDFSSNNADSASFQLSYAGEFTDSIVIGASASEIELNLESLGLINDVEVSQQYNQDSSGRYQLIYTITFLLTSNWNDDSLFMSSDYFSSSIASVSKLAFGNRIDRLSVSGDGSGVYEFEVRDNSYSEGVQGIPCLFTAMVVSESNSESLHITNAEITLYVLPTLDLPTVSAPTHVNMQEDQSYLLSRVSLVSLDTNQYFSDKEKYDAVYTLHIASESIDIDAVRHTSNSVPETVFENQSGMMSISKLVGTSNYLSEVLSEGLILKPFTNYYGESRLLFILSDVRWPNTSSVTTVSITVQQMPDDCYLSMETSKTMLALANIPTGLPLISIVDPDGSEMDKFTLHISVNISTSALHVPILTESIEYNGENSYIPIEWQSVYSFVDINGNKLLLKAVLKHLRFQGTFDTLINITMTPEFIERTLPKSFISIPIAVLHASNYAIVDGLTLDCPDEVTPHIEEDHSWTNISAYIRISSGFSLSNHSDVKLYELVMICELGVFAHLENYSLKSKQPSTYTVMTAGDFIRISGVSTSSVHEALGRIVYIPPENYFGSVLFQISLDVDLAVISKDFIIYVNPRPDLPLIRTTADYSNTVSQPVLLMKTFEVVDVDQSQRLQVILSCNLGGSLAIMPLGRQYLVSAPDRNEISSLNGFSQLKFVVHPRNFTNLMNYLLYSPPAYYNGIEVVTLNVTTAPDSWVSKSVSFNIDTPSDMSFQCVDKVNMYEDSLITVSEICKLLVNIQRPFPSVNHLTSDGNNVINSDGLDYGFVTLDISATNLNSDSETVLGYFNVSDEARAFVFRHSLNSDATILRLQANLQDISAIMSLIQFTGQKDKNGRISIHLKAQLDLVLNSFTSLTAEIESIDVTILPVNDLPLVSVTHPLDQCATTLSSHSSTCLHNNTLQVYKGEFTALSFITIYDVDLDESSFGWIDVNVSANQGICDFYVGQSTELDILRDILVLDDGSVSRVVHMSSHDPEVLTHIFSAGFIRYLAPSSGSSDQITITASDNGFYGINVESKSQSFPNSLRMDISILSRQRLPSLSVIDNQLLGVEDEPLLIDTSRVLLDPGEGSTLLHTYDIVTLLFISPYGDLVSTYSDHSVSYYTDNRTRTQGVNITSSFQSVLHLLTNNKVQLTFVPIADVAYMTFVNVTLVFPSLNTTGPLSSLSDAIMIFLRPIEDVPSVVIGNSNVASAINAWMSLSAYNISIRHVDMINAPDVLSQQLNSLKLLIKVFGCGMLNVQSTNGLLRYNTTNTKVFIDMRSPVDVNSCIRSEQNFHSLTSLKSSTDSEGYSSITVQSDLDGVFVGLNSISYLASPRITDGEAQTIEITVKSLTSMKSSTVLLPVNIRQSLESDSDYEPYEIIIKPYLELLEGSSELSGNDLLEKIDEKNANNRCDSFDSCQLQLTVNFTNMLPSSVSRQFMTSLTVPNSFQRVIEVASAHLHTGSDWIASSKLTGGFHSVIEAFRQSTVTPPDYFHGIVRVSLSFSLTDASGMKVLYSASSKLRVLPVNNSPAIIFTAPLNGNRSNYYELDEDVSSALPIGVIDQDILFLEMTESPYWSESPELCCQLRLQLTCFNCMILSTSTIIAPSSPSLNNGEEFGYTHLDYVGTYQNVLELIDSLSVCGVRDYFGEATLNVTVSDFDYLLTNSSETTELSIQIVVNSINDYPSFKFSPFLLTVPSSATSALVFDADRSSLALDLVHDVDVNAVKDTYRAVVSCSNGTLSLTVQNSNDTSAAVQRIELFDSLLGINLKLSGLLYTPASGFFGQDHIKICVADAFNATSCIKITVSVQKRVIHTYIQSDSSANSTEIFDANTAVMLSEFGLNVGSTEEDASTLDLTLVVDSLHYSQLLIQQVSIIAPPPPIIQSIQAYPLGGGDIINGSFVLCLDLQDIGGGLMHSEPISYDAVALESDEDIQYPHMGQSIQSKINSLLSRTDLNITVSRVSKQVYKSKVLPNNVVEWQITFSNASIDLPLLTVSANNLISSQINSSNGSDVNVATYSLTSSSVAVDGSFSLTIGGTNETTAQIIHNATDEMMAKAIEGLGIVRKVGVSRSQEGLNNGYTWTITYYSFRSGDLLTPIGPSLPLIANKSQLIGTYTYTRLIESGTLGNDRAIARIVVAPTVSIRTEQVASGNPSVYSIQTTATHLNQMTELSFSTLNPNDIEFFHVVLMYQRFEVRFNATVGPLYFSTVATVHEEGLGHKLGQLLGQSLQNQLQSIWFMEADNIQVLVDRRLSISNSKYGNMTRVSWLVTFLNALSSPEYSFNFVPMMNMATPLLDENSFVSVKHIQHQNYLGGAFALSFGGKSRNLTFDASEVDVIDALQSLNLLLEVDGTRQVFSVSRRGPDVNLGYTWIIAVLQDIALLSSQLTRNASAVLSVDGTYLTGLGSQIELKFLNEAPPDYSSDMNEMRKSITRANSGFKLLSSVSGVANVRSFTSMMEFESRLMLIGTLTTLSLVLKSVQYLPPQYWFGEMAIKVTVLCNDNVQSECHDSSIQIPIRIAKASSRFKVFYESSVLNEDTDGTLVTVYEDTMVNIGHSNPLFDESYEDAFDRRINTEVNIGTQQVEQTYQYSKSVIENPGLRVMSDDYYIGDICIDIGVSRGYISINREYPNVGKANLTARTSSGVYIPVVLSTGTVVSPELSPSTHFQYIQVTGPIIDVNLVLSSLTFQSCLHCTGYDRISFHLSSCNEVFGDAEMQTVAAAGILNIDILPINNPPIILIKSPSTGISYNSTLYDDDSSWPVELFHLRENSYLEFDEILDIIDPDLDVKKLDKNIDYLEEEAVDLQNLTQGLYSSDIVGSSDFVYVSLSVELGTMNVGYLGTIQLLNNQSSPNDPTTFFNSTSIDVSCNPFRYIDIATDISVNAQSVSQPAEASRCSSIFLKGHLHDIRAAVQSLRYYPPQHWFGLDVMTIYVNDLGNVGKGGPKDLTRKLLIQTDEVQSWPSIVLPEKDVLEVYEDVPGVIGSDCCHWLENAYGRVIMNISALSLTVSDSSVPAINDWNTRRFIVRTTNNSSYIQNDVPHFNNTYDNSERSDLYRYVYEFKYDDKNDSIYVESLYRRDNFTVSLSVKHGRLSIQRSFDGLMTLKGSLTEIDYLDRITFLHGSGFQDDKFSVQGKLLDINLVLRGLVYESDRDWNSLKSNGGYEVSTLDSLLVTVRNSYGNSVSRSVNILVRPVNDPPVLGYGKHLIHNHNVFTSAEYYASKDIIKLIPVKCFQHTDCELDSFNDLTISDVDVDDIVFGSVNVILQVSHGIFLVNRDLSELITFYSQLFGSHSSSLTLDRSLYSLSSSKNQSVLNITVPLTQINKLFQGLLYRPLYDYYGNDTLSITVSDLGNSGICPDSISTHIAYVGHDLRSEFSCPLTASVQVPMIIQLHGNYIDFKSPTQVFTTLEDIPVVIDGFFIKNHRHFYYSSVEYAYFSDLLKSSRIEIPYSFNHTYDNRSFNSLYEELSPWQDDEFSLTISSNHGNVSLPITALSLNETSHHISFVEGDGDDDSYLLLTGALSAINWCLSYLVFMPAAHLNYFNSGLAVITLTAREIGDNIDDPLSVTREVAVLIQPVNNPPVITVPGEVFVYEINHVRDLVPLKASQTVDIEENTEYSLGGVVIEDVDNSEYISGISKLTLEANHGTFSSYNKTVLSFLHSFETLSSNMDEKRFNPLSNTTVTLLAPYFDSINNWLASIYYTPHKSYFGNDSITITVHDRCVNTDKNALSNTLNISASNYDKLAQYFVQINETVNVSSCSLSDVRVIPVYISGVNDPPRWIYSNLPYITSEDVSIRLHQPGIRELGIADVDSGNHSILVKLSVDFGTLTIDSAIPYDVSTLKGTGLQDQVMQLLGPVSSLTQLLKSLVYNPLLHWNSIKSGGLPDIIHLYADDLGNSACDSSVSSNETLRGLGLVGIGEIVVITVPGVNHKPLIYLPGASYVSEPCLNSQQSQLFELYQTLRIPEVENVCETLVSVETFHVDEDTLTSVHGIYVKDPDDDYNVLFGDLGDCYQVILSSLIGDLSIDRSSTMTALVYPSQSEPHFKTARESSVIRGQNLTVIGSLSGINEVLARLKYQAPQNYYGPDVVDVHVKDRMCSVNHDDIYSVSHIDHQTLPILVDPVDDIPLVVTPGDILTVLEDHRLVIPGVYVVDQDFIEFDTVVGHSLDINDNYYEASKVNASERLVRRSIADQIFNFSLFQSQQTMNLLSVNITVKYGTVMLTSMSGLTVDRPSDSLWYQNLSFIGRLDDINRALDHLLYSPLLNWNSDINNDVETISITATISNRNSKIQANQKAVIRVKVVAVNDAPVLIVPDAVYALHPVRYTDDMLSIVIVNSLVREFAEGSSFSIDGINIRDVDVTPHISPRSADNITESSEQGYVRVNMTCELGKVTIRWQNAAVSSSLSTAAITGAGSNIGLYYEYGNGFNDSTLIFLGPLAVVNEAIKTIEFTPYEYYFGLDASLIITVDDLGNHGVGGPKLDTHIVHFAIQPVNNAPVITIPQDHDPVYLPGISGRTVGSRRGIFVVDEGQVLTIDGAYRQPYSDDIQLSLSLSHSNSPENMGFELIRLRYWSYQQQQNFFPVSTYVNTSDDGNYSYSNSTFIEMYYDYNLSNISALVFDQPTEYNVSNYLSSASLSLDNSASSQGKLEWNDNFYMDIYPGPRSSYPRFFTQYQNFLYFQANDGVHGSELWRDFIDENSNIWSEHGPTPSQTRSASLFADLTPGSSSSNPSYLTVHNSSLFFSSSGIDTSWMMLPKYRDACQSFRQSSFDSRVHFAVSESTNWEINRRYDCPLGFHWATTAEGFLYFPTVDSADNTEPKTYQNECGWVGSSYGSKLRRHFRFSDSYFTRAYKDSGKPDSFRPDIDGNSLDQSTWLVKEFAGIICVVGREISTSGLSGNGLWRSDGTVEGTSRLEVLIDPQFLTSVNGQFLYFTAESPEASIIGRQLFRTSGTDYSSAQVVGLFGNDISFSGAEPSDLTAVGDRLFFTATSANLGRELWQLNINDGNNGVPYPVDLFEGVSGSNPGGYETTNGGKLPMFFYATSPGEGEELWITDGSYLGSTMVKDICVGERSSRPRFITWFEPKQRVYFHADDCIHGVELWTSDGTNSGTYLLRDINSNSPSSFPSYLVVCNGYLYFIATDVGVGDINYSKKSCTGVCTGLEGIEQVWVSDGTKEGTIRAFDKSGVDVAIDHAGLLSLFPSRLTEYNGDIYVAGYFHAAGIVGPVTSAGGAGMAHTSNILESRQDNYDAIAGFGQAVVVQDIDTACDRNITVTLHLSHNGIGHQVLQNHSDDEIMNSGLIILKPSQSENQNTDSKSVLRILVADGEEPDATFILNHLSKAGHIVDVVYSGYHALETIKIHNSVAAIIKIPEPISRYNCVLVSLEYLKSDNKSAWDGLQTIRAIRAWESNEFGYNTTRAGNNLMNDQLIIIGMAKHDNYIHVTKGTGSAVSTANELMVAAGANYFLVQPITVTGESGETDLRTKAAEYDAYRSFASQLLKFLAVRDYKCSISASTSISLASISNSTQHLGSILGSTIRIEGSLQQVNKLLQVVYYDAVKGTRGNISLTITATDQPQNFCLQSVISSVNVTWKNLQQYPSLPLIPLAASDMVSGSEGSPVKVSSTCESVNTNTLINTVKRVIPIFVLAVNQAPFITFPMTDSSVSYSDTGDITVTAAIEMLTRLPTIRVDDLDHSNMGQSTLTQTQSFLPTSPAVSVILQVTSGSGRLSLDIFDNIALTQGQGIQDRIIAFRGSLEAVNKVLSAVFYNCRHMDKCVGARQEVIKITVNDEGFVGKGGPLEASQRIFVDVK